LPLGQAPLAWLSYGHTLKTVGRQADAVAAYRKAIAQRPVLGEAWWSLANLKTVRFDEEDRAPCARLWRVGTFPRQTGSISISRWPRLARMRRG
jgi:hypothetical protein